MLLRKKDLIIQLREFNLELAMNEKSMNTIKYYNQAINRLLSMVNDDQEVSKDILIKYKANLIDSGDYKMSTIDRHLQAINRFLVFCGRKDLTIKRLKLQNKMSYDKVITQIDLKRLLKWSKKLNRQDIYLIIKVFANTGIRVSELKYFKVEKLNSIIEINNKNKIRFVPIRQELLRELRKYCKHQKIEEGFIFTNKRNKKLKNPTIIWRELKYIAGRARVDKSKVHAHSFRHYFAYQFLEQNGDNSIFDLADILGHSQIEVTRIYARSNNAGRLKKIEKLKYNN